MRKLIGSLTIGLVLILSAALAAVSPVHADQYGPYGGPEEEKDIIIDKLVGRPFETKGGKTNVEYVDNISHEDFTFDPFDVVFFKLIVRNTSDVRLTDVVVRDFAPDHFTLFENPGDVDGDVLTLHAGDFEPGEEKVYVIRGRIDHADNVPAGTICVVNRVRAEDNGTADEDTARFCFNKPGKKGDVVKVVTPPETIPQAGPEHGALVSGLALAIGYMGLRLRRV